MATGDHTLSGPQAFGLTSYGFGSADAYSEPGGYGAGQVANVAFLTLSPPDQSSGTGQQACVTATVEDINHNPLAGIGVSFAVTGANPTNGFASTQANGQATFCYTGTKAGSDLVTATSGSLSATATVEFGGVPGHNAIGYRLQGGDGGVFDYGQSQFYGSLPGIRSAPRSSRPPTPTTTAGTGWPAPTAVSSPSVMPTTTAACTARRSTRRSWVSRPRRTWVATGWWPPTAASSPSATPQYYGSMGGLHLNAPIVGYRGLPQREGLLAGRRRRRGLQLR